MAGKLKYILFTYDGSALAVAKKLVDEGNSVIVAQIQNASELHNGTAEARDSRRKRLSLYDGILEKRDARGAALDGRDAEQGRSFRHLRPEFALVLCAEGRAARLYPGVFPTRQDTEYEDVRTKGKDLARQFWPDLTVAEVHTFRTADEGIRFLDERPDDMFVLKANAEGDLTVVPQSDDAEIARENLIGALTAKRDAYESMGYILELRITNPVEITPQMIFYDGRPVSSHVDIENKPIGAGSVGNMTGCSGNLVFKTRLSDEINRIAFPPKVHEMAKAHPGLFVWDASLLIDARTRKIHFGEFCPNRWGYDSFFTEIAMSEGASAYFEAIVAGRIPAAAVRGSGPPVQSETLRGRDRLGEKRGRHLPVRRPPEGRPAGQRRRGLEPPRRHRSRQHAREGRREGVRDAGQRLLHRWLLSAASSTSKAMNTRARSRTDTTSPTAGSTRARSGTPRTSAGSSNG